MSKFRVWLLTNIPSPYQVELLKRVDQILEGGLDVRFFGEWRTKDSSLSNLPFANLGLRSHGFGKRPETWIHPTAIHETKHGDWDAYVLSGTLMSPTLWRCASVLRSRNLPQILWLERPHPQTGNTVGNPRWLANAPIRFCKNKFVKRLLQRSTGIIAMGSKACAEYREWGVASERIANQPYAIDAKRFHPPAVVPGYRSPQPTILFSGQLIPRKGIETLCEIFVKVLEHIPQTRLLVLGSGIQRPVLESLQERFPDQVTLAGQVSQEELPAYFHRADLFLFPSRHDGWGVVVNEAIGAGLPIITTLQTGAAHDLVEAGKNGFLFDASDVDSMTRATIDLLQDHARRCAFSQESIRIAESHSLDKAAQTWIRNVQTLAGRPMAFGTEVQVNP